MEEAERELLNPGNDLADRLIVTKAVIEEALRLYPPIAALSRVAVEADVLGDMSVKPGSLIVIAPYVLHRHHKLWSRPDVFDPSRFLTERGGISRFAYLPFGIGPRICIGSSFALQEAAIVLAVLNRQFEYGCCRTPRSGPFSAYATSANGLPMQLIQNKAF